MYYPEPILILVHGFLEAGKNRLADKTGTDAITGEIKSLRKEASDLKKMVAALVLELCLTKKAYILSQGKKH